MPEPYEGYAEGLRAVQLPDPKVPNYLLDTFGRPERVTPCACERAGEVTMPQVLHLMNGEALPRRIADGDGPPRRLLASGKPDREVADRLFLAALGRPPTDAQWQAVRTRPRRPRGRPRRGLPRPGLGAGQLQGVPVRALSGRNG